MSDKYFFDHLQDDITKDHHREGKGYNPFNKFDAESNDDFVNPVCNVLAASNDEGTEQSIMKPLSKKQLAKIITSDVPMYLRKSPPKTLIAESTTQNILLMLPNTNLSTMLVASSAKKLLIVNCQFYLKPTLRSRKFPPRSQRSQRHWRLKNALNLQSSSSEESETDSLFNAKYEAHMKTLGCAFFNWQFEKCYLSNCPAMRCQFKDGCSNFAHKRCSILWLRTHRQNVKDIESIGHFC